MESVEVIKIKENPVFELDFRMDHGKGVTKERIENSNAKSRQGSILIENDDIPLIDSQSEDISVVDYKKKERPTLFENPQKLHFKPSVWDSPDIFHLRAPHVSCENLLTPAISTDMLLDSFDCGLSPMQSSLYLNKCFMILDKLKRHGG